MKIEDAYWTPEINILLIRCDCGCLFKQRADRRSVICCRCGNKGDLLMMKSYLQESRDTGNVDDDI
jgi:hypothetical protein